MDYDAKIWGPKYWFFLHSVARCYPLYPNETIKRKYYDFIMNFPLFIPDKEISGYFEKLIDKYPVTPYLDSRESFMRWIYFIHNKINEKLGKPQKTYEAVLFEFNKYYEKIEDKTNRYKKSISYGINTILIIGLVLTALFLYRININ